MKKGQRKREKKGRKKNERKKKEENIERKKKERGRKEERKRENCLSRLYLLPDDALFNLKEGFHDVQKVRSRLRDLEFKTWCELPNKGKGVELFANRWITHHKGLTCSEWRDALKMAGNVAAVRAIPGRTMDNNCRHCGSEIETLPHVLGSCPHGEALRNTRHYKVRSAIAQALRNTRFTVFEEVHGLSTTGSTRRIDMIAFQDHRRGFTINPTVRFEIYKSQPQDVHKEKQFIYEPTITYYQEKYKLQQIDVISSEQEDPSQSSLFIFGSLFICHHL
ncbi:hypothetical protein ANN_01590 [Periplaneta americana]|uniref:Reverse transcriptase n=1 Tax=Periplaneta americana TaxID=6978 RepID=A0ABQ8TWF1_PERAM|nr:hypothetical protein ANN_01590 [Periplaneta americana]